MISYHIVVFFVANFINNAASQHNRHLSSNVGIIGGHSISIDKVPFMASLRLNGTYHWCGASIIHEQFVLTAAHCILPNRKYNIRVGTDLVNQGGTLYDIEKIIAHELYSEKSNDYDICLIKLNTTLSFGPKVGKIELTGNTLKLRKGMLLDVTGWGYTGVNKTISKNLLQVAIPVVPAQACQIMYIKALRRITPRMVCVGGHGRDSCQGDSGGPLTRNNEQVGITSFGSGCGSVPGVYTKIVPMLPWIKRTIDENT